MAKTSSGGEKKPVSKLRKRHLERLLIRIFSALLITTILGIGYVVRDILKSNQHYLLAYLILVFGMLLIIGFFWLKDELSRIQKIVTKGIAYLSYLISGILWILGAMKLAPPHIPMIAIPAGNYPIGTDTSEHAVLSKRFSVSIKNFENDLPFENYYTESFQISQYEISVEQYRLFLKLSNHPKPPNWTKQVSKGKYMPVTFVSYTDAARYCNWLSDKIGKKYRLPTEKEWEIAARGKDRRTYPWGEIRPSKQYINLDQDGPASIKAFPSDRSPFGVEGMAGNVAEWCSSPCKIGNIIRGGSWKDLSPVLFRCANRQCNALNEPNIAVGFRVVQQ
jgi:formylglycine-generating enzyme required for sulfatase activity